MPVQSPKRTINLLAAIVDAKRRGILPIPQSRAKESDPLTAIRETYTGVVDNADLVKTSNDIIKELVKVGWQKIGQQDDPPKVTSDDLRRWMPSFDSERVIFRLADDPAEYPDPPPADPEPEAWDAKVWHRFDRCYLLHNKSLAAPTLYTYLHNPLERTEEGVSTKEITEIENHDAARRRYTAAAALWMIITGGITHYNIVEVHLFWREVKKMHNDCKHPLAPIVQAWLQDQVAKRITKAYDVRHPAAIIKGPMGSIRDIGLQTTAEIAEIKGVVQTPESEQLLLTDLEPKSILPPLLPLETVQYNGAMTTRDGRVAMPIRLFFEALMSLAPRETKVDIHFRLGDLIQYLNPHGKFNRTNQLPNIIRGLESLFYIRIPYKPANAGEVNWVPIIPRTLPNERSDNDSPIILSINLPPDATAGMMVEKDVLRVTGKDSSAKFNAYLTACWLFNRYGTVKGHLIDPTMPEGERTDKGELIDAKGKVIKDSTGKPVRNAYRPEAVRTLPRVRNPRAEKYPILSFDDIRRTCFPLDTKKTAKATVRQHLLRAKKAWEELEAEEFVRIEKYQNGWRIMPGVSHITRYRALKSGKN